MCSGFTSDQCSGSVATCKASALALHYHSGEKSERTLSLNLNEQKLYSVR